MTERWVLNSSPLIALGRIGYTHLLSELATDIAIPCAVADEIKAGPTDDRAYHAVMDNAHHIVDTSLAPEVLAWDLGAGETAVISYTVSHPGWKVVLDDPWPADAHAVLSCRPKALSLSSSWQDSAV